MLVDRGGKEKRKVKNESKGWSLRIGWNGDAIDRWKSVGGAGSWLGGDRKLGK